MEKLENLELGRRIRNLRVAQGLTIKEVAEKSSITSSMLSQLERGKANPSINTLRSLAQALDVSLFSFFSSIPQANDLVTRKEEQKIVPSLDFNRIEYRLLSSESNMNIQMALMRIYPHGNSVDKAMQHVGEEVAYVLSGTVDVLLGHEWVTLFEGDCVKIPSGMVHKWVNKSDDTVNIIFSVSPPSF